MATFGEQLRHAREARNFTVAELSTASGVSIDTIYRFESGRHTRPSFAMVIKLARSLATPLEHFAEAEDLGSDLVPAVMGMPVNHDHHGDNLPLGEQGDMFGV